MVTNKTVFFMIGILLVVLGFSMLIPYTIQIIYNENSHSFVSSSFVTIFIGILFGISDELHQSFVPGRHYSLMDVIFDSLGVLFGTSIRTKYFSFSLCHSFENSTSFHSSNHGPTLVK